MIQDFSRTIQGFFLLNYAHVKKNYNNKLITIYILRMKDMLISPNSYFLKYCMRTYIMKSYPWNKVELLVKETQLHIIWTFQANHF